MCASATNAAASVCARIIEVVGTRERQADSQRAWDDAAALIDRDRARSVRLGGGCDEGHDIVPGADASSRVSESHRHGIQSDVACVIGAFGRAGVSGPSSAIVRRTVFGVCVAPSHDVFEEDHVCRIVPCRWGLGTLSPVLPTTHACCGSDVPCICSPLTSSICGTTTAVVIGALVRCTRCLRDCRRFSAGPDTSAGRGS